MLHFSLEELGAIKVDTVFAASKFSQKITNAPASVTIVTREDIARFGYRTLSDIVRATRSFDVISDRAFAYTGARGFTRDKDVPTGAFGVVVNGPYTTVDSRGYTRHLSEDSETGKELGNFPRDAFRAQVAVPIFGGKLSAGIELLHQSDRFTERRDRNGDTWLVNATLRNREPRRPLPESSAG